MLLKNRPSNNQTNPDYLQYSNIYILINIKDALIFLANSNFKFFVSVSSQYQFFMFQFYSWLNIIIESK